MAGTYTKLFYHVVFSTKHRQNLITPAIEQELYKYVAGILRGIGGSCVAVNGMPDHLHLLAILPAKIALSDALREVKANSSKWLHQSKPAFANFSWQDGYAAFTVSKSAVDSVCAYIRDQKLHHLARDFRGELLELLARHEVEFDERYVWDGCRRCAAFGRMGSVSGGLRPRLRYFAAARLETRSCVTNPSRPESRQRSSEQAYSLFPVR